MIKSNNRVISHKNRGMNLENDINITNDYYLNKDIAVIYKKPTPIQVSKVSFNKNSKLIKEAFYKTQSTTDYNGIYKGLYIDFDAKEVKDKDYFALSNLHAHQLEHLTKVSRHGGISFIIVRFCNKNKTFLLETKEIINFINNEKRKSITIEYFIEHAHLIKEAYIPRLDYISIIDKLYVSHKEVS